MKNQQLKDFMEARGLQQKQTAQMLDISIPTLSLYLKGSSQAMCNKLMKRWKP